MQVIFAVTIFLSRDSNIRDETNAQVYTANPNQDQVMGKIVVHFEPVMITNCRQAFRYHYD